MQNRQNKTNNFLDDIKQTTKAYTFKNVTPLANLPINFEFNIEGLQKTPSKFYGERLAATLSFNAAHGERTIYTVFLPDRFARLSDKQIKRILTHDPPIKLIYGGKNSNGVHEIDFLE